MVTVNWFVLPPVMEWYYKSKNPSYKPLPALRGDCAEQEGNQNMDLIYPREKSIIFIPRELDGTLGSTVFEAAHRKPDSEIFWHLNGEFVGQTRHIHQLAISTGEGNYILTLVDESGEILTRTFCIAGR
jgi:penicillin-binding protein 1C